MQIGIGLPNPIPGTQGRTLVEWARRAEARGFSTLATIDRIAYPNYDSLISLAAAAAVTERIGLLTNVLLAPTRNPVVLAKAAASVDQISGGRLTLGLGVGGREDDYTATGLDFKTRGRRFDADLELLHRAWKGEPVAGSPKPVTPTPVHDGRVPILIGGSADAAIERTLRWGAGWTMAGSAAQAAPFLARIRQAWQEAGKPGKPRIAGLIYFGLGPNVDTGIPAYIKDYYSFVPGPEQLAASVPRTAEALQSAVKEFEDLDVDEIIFVPTIAEIAQVDLLADAVLPK
jgi:alkanesulfonate monooxygenase SsuD/methylene tetrahydromethanopterin reductase-like flavin-dependent oxidoreductase (luciferase family)